MRFAKLRGRIREKLGTLSAFAEAMELHPSTIINKLSGRTDWKGEDIAKACRILDIPPQEIPEYFEYFF